MIESTSDWLKAHEDDTWRIDFDHNGNGFDVLSSFIHHAFVEDGTRECQMEEEPRCCGSSSLKSRVKSGAFNADVKLNGVRRWLIESLVLH